MNTKHKHKEYRFKANQYPLTSGMRMLEASAGTGKTFALAHLVLRLLTEEDIDLKQILVVTFTDSAASELRFRISKRISEALKGLEAIRNNQSFAYPDEVLKEWLLEHQEFHSQSNKWASNLLVALESLDYSDITTIHGFCKRTLLRDPLLSGVSINPKLEGNSKEIIIEVVNEYWQSQILELESKHIYGLQESGLSPENIVKALIKVDNDPSLKIESAEQILRIKEPLNKQFESLMENYWLNFIKQWNEDGHKLESDLRIYAEGWRCLGMKDTKPFTPKPRSNREEEIDIWIQTLERDLSTASGPKSPSYGTIREQSILGRYYHPAVFCEVAKRCGDYKQSLARAQLQVTIAELWDGPAEQVWKHALQWGQQRIKQLRENKGLMSYGELLKALDPEEQEYSANQNTPKDNLSPWVDSLRKRYRIVLVDEFQDTDPVQWRILKHAFAKSSSHLLLMVGDPKQAIYKFRGGDINTYLKARNEVDRIDELLDNFRTTPQLMSGLNQLIAPELIRSKLRAPITSSFRKEQDVRLPEGQKALQVLLIKGINEPGINMSSELLSKSYLEKKIPLTIANAIIKLLKECPDQLNLSDICILVNRHDQALSIRSGLSHAGLPSRLLHKGDIFDTEAAHILQIFLSCLSNPSKTSNLKLLGCTALLQWSIEELNDSEEKGLIDLLAKQFIELGIKLPKLGVWGCLIEFIQGRIRAELYTRGGLINELQQCAELVETEIKQQGWDITYATNWLKRQRLHPEEPIPDSRQPYSDKSERAVNVVTIHRSKGQEYPVVICPYLWAAPPKPRGPIWRNSESQNWSITINSRWGEGQKVAEKAIQDSLEESERLAYVAITRAREILMILWVQAAGQEGNPLSSLLFGPEALNKSLLELSTDRLERRLTTESNSISISEIDADSIIDHWKPPKFEGKLTLGPIPNRPMDLSWGRSSYSSWISGGHLKGEVTSSNKNVYEEGDDEENNDGTFKLVTPGQITFDTGTDSINHANWELNGPLSNFPRGKSPGNCLHKIIERVDFSEPINSPDSKSIIEEELRRADIDIIFSVDVQAGLERLLNTSLGINLDNLQLRQLNSSRRINELNFDLPVAIEGEALRPRDLAKIFELNPKAKFSSDYAKQIENLKFNSRGFLTGSIDLVFTDKEDLSVARWWVADWKSNWIGHHSMEDKGYSCGPMNYQKDAIDEQMVRHHYPLQAHIYLVALHRYLKWRLPGYKAETHLGGYTYVFLRGLPKPQRNNTFSDNAMPGLIVEKAPLKRIFALDQLLNQGAQ